MSYGQEILTWGVKPTGGTQHLYEYDQGPDGCSPYAPRVYVQVGGLSEVIVDRWPVRVAVGIDQVWECSIGARVVLDIGRHSKIITPTVSASLYGVYTVRQVFNWPFDVYAGAGLGYQFDAFLMDHDVPGGLFTGIIAGTNLNIFPFMGLFAEAGYDIYWRPFSDQVQLATDYRYGYGYPSVTVGIRINF